MIEVFVCVEGGGGLLYSYLCEDQFETTTYGVRTFWPVHRIGLELGLGLVKVRVMV